MRYVIWCQRTDGSENGFGWGTGYYEGGIPHDNKEKTYVHIERIIAEDKKYGRTNDWLYEARPYTGK
jgi:hypothetical protein